ncbi:MAG: chitobiase/beta-hexosaminidase C-terminal domain-containing protein [Kiritimatiellae bacterium]|nr:chitobiase/beta-hexosaminidase C-terminal domain-containing protein [Kiritimatiellia bacterium]
MRKWLRVVIGGLAVAGAWVAAGAEVAAEKIFCADDPACLSVIRLTFSGVEAPARLYLAWAAEDKGDDLAAWTGSVAVGSVTAETASLDIPAPFVYNCFDPAFAVIRFFLSSDTGVTPLETVYGNGQQEVDLGYSPTAQTRCQVKFRYTNRNGGHFVGTQTGNDQNDWRFFCSSDGTAYVDLGSNDARISGPYVSSTETVYEYEFGNYYLKDLVSGVTLMNATPVTFPANYTNPIYLFGVNKSYGIIYAIRFYEGDQLTREYLPAKDGSGVACLYERVDGRCYYSSGEPLLAGTVPTDGGWAAGQTGEVSGASVAVAMNGTEWVTADGARQLGAVTISEVMAKNGSTLTTAEGDASDWVELVNASDYPVNLCGWGLSDNPKAGKWNKRVLPAGAIIPARGRMIVYCDSYDMVCAAGEVHVSLGLSTDAGEYIGLAQPDGRIVSSFTYPDQYEDVTYGFARERRSLVVGATDGIGFSTTIGSFRCTQYNFVTSSGRISSPDMAESLIADPSKWDGEPVTKWYRTIAFNEGGGSLYGGVAFPGNSSSSSCRDYYAVVCEGNVMIPEAGMWTFCCGSDDGFRCVITGHGCTFSFEYDGTRGYASEPLGQFNFPEAGVYAIRLVCYDYSSGAACDFTVAQGQVETFSTETFKLVGGAASGVVHASALANWIGTDVSAEMAGKTQAVWSRTFTFEGDPDANQQLELRARYKDGFIARLNGVELLRVNADGTTARELADAQSESIFTLPATGLQNGENSLEVTAIAASANTADFLFAADLDWIGEETALAYLAYPTPGTVNAKGLTPPTPQPVFSVPHGYKTAPFDLTISCPDRPDAEIRYTLDGTEPGGTSPRYTEPLRIASTTVIRARVVDPDSVLSREVCSTYIFLDEILQQPSTPPAGFPASGAVNGQAMYYAMNTGIVNGPNRDKVLRGFTNTIATISIVIDPTYLFDRSSGIYVNCRQKGQAWERKGMVEQIDPVHGEVNEFCAPMGLRIRGAASRTSSYPKHSFRFFFREEYGLKTVTFPFFGEEGTDRYRRMDLRTSQNYSWANNPNEGGWLNDTFVCEAFERDAQRDFGQPYTRSRYYNLFINGCYWGLYQTQERADDHFAASYLGGDNEDYDAFNVNELNAGTDDARRALHAMAVSGFTDNDVYRRAQGLNADGTRNEELPVYLDVTNLVTRTLIGHYAADGDSPYSVWSNFPNNFFSVRNRTAASTGFKWFCHDGEHALGMGVAHGDCSVSSNPVNWGNNSNLNNFNSHYLNYRLMQNAEYKMVFADHVRKHVIGPGLLSVEANLARFRSRMAEVDDAIVCEAARWGRNGQTYATWTNACTKMIDGFIRQRNSYLVQHYQNAGWYPQTAAPEISAEDGASLMPGASIQITAAAVLYYTLDGSDPRLWGGEVNPAAVRRPAGSGATVTMPGLPIHVMARAYNTSTREWSALTDARIGCAAQAAALRFHEFSGVPADGKKGDSGEYVVLTNLSTEVTVDLTGVRVVLLKQADAIADAQCDFTIPAGELPPSGTFRCEQSEFGWQKITNNKLYLYLYDSEGKLIQRGAVTQRNYPTVYGAGGPGGGASLYALTFETEIPEEGWRPSYPLPEPERGADAVHAVIAADDRVGVWLNTICREAAGEEAVRAFAGTEEDLLNCYAINLLPVATPDIHLAFDGIALAPDGTLTVTSVLRVGTTPHTARLNGTVELLHYLDLNADPEVVPVEAEAFPLRLEGLHLAQPRGFYGIRIR